MTDAPTPKRLHDTLTETETQQNNMKKILAAFNSRPETRNAVADALKIEDFDGETVYETISAGYNAIQERVQQIEEIYVHGIVKMPKNKAK